MLRYLTAGESHGDSLIGILEGMVAGVRIDRERLSEELRWRRIPLGRSKRMALEEEEFEILSGVRNGLTTGAPISIRILNRDQKSLNDFSPRPGHADLAGCIKYGFRNIHLIAERASGRETCVRVALGAVAKSFLENFHIYLVSHTIGIGEIFSGKRVDFEFLRERRSHSPIFCVDNELEPLMIEEIMVKEKEGDTVGGAAEVICKGVPPGLGSHVHYDRRADFRIGGALLSIPGVKGAEFGERLPYGSLNNDEIELKEGKIIRKSNRAGGIEGGITNGEAIVVRLTVKPPPSLRRNVPSVDLEKMIPSNAPIIRGDTCIVPSVGIIAEGVMALEVSSLFLEKFGGDHLEETKRNWLEYMNKCPAFSDKGR